MERDFKGVWIPKEIWLNEDLGWSEKLLLVEIDSLSRNDECFASNDHFARFLQVSTRQVQNLLSSLKEKGLISVELFYREGSKEVEKRVISPRHEINFATPSRNKVQEGHEENFATPHEIRCITPHEKNFVDNNTLVTNTFITNTTTNTKKNKRNSTELESEFEVLWSFYPRKMGKAKALQSYIKARKTKGIPYETIENGLYRYIDYLKVQETEEQFIMHGSTWFNQEKWLDEYVLIPRKKKSSLFIDIWEEDNGFKRNERIIDYDSSHIQQLF